MKRSILLIVYIALISSVYGQTIPNPGQKDVIIIDNGASGKADPNDRIQYNVTIQNTGGADGTGAQLNIVPDPRTTFVAGSFRSSPLALNDAYTCTGNVGINVPAAIGFKVNDFDDNIGAATITAGTFATTGLGSITIAADGGFTYTPAAGFIGADTYAYTLNDANGVGGGVPSTDMATVTITVSNMIWFVDNTSGGSGGTGTLAVPFKSLADFNGSSGPATGQLIFVKNTGNNYTGGIVLKNSQVLFGTGHTGGANLANVLPFSLAPNSNSLPAIMGSRPFITNNVGAGILLASGNTIIGIEAGTTTTNDYAIRDNGATVGTLTIGDAAISGATGGFRAGSAGALSATFVSISTSGGTGGTNGINLSGCSGSFTVNGGTITNPSGTAVLIAGGSVTVSSSGAITNNSGLAVDVDNHDSNNVTFSGIITSTGNGIRVQNCGGGTKTFSSTSKSLTTGANNAITLSNNTGAIINISGGGLAISTTSGIGFNTTGGGTISVTGSGNTIASTTGTALNVSNTTIGASNLIFQSISSGAGTNNGIVLDNTGSSGGLIVNGDGSNTSVGGNSSGGTISGKSGVDNNFTQGIGIYLNNTSNVVLRRMTINGTNQNHGIRGFSVNNFTLEYSTVAGTNGTNAFNNGVDQYGEGSIVFGNQLTNGLTGAASITNCNISGGASRNLSIVNISGSLNRITITGSTFGLNQNIANQIGNQSLAMEARNLGTVLNATVTNCTFTGSPSDQSNFTGQTSTTMDVIYQNNTVSNSHAQNIIGGGNLNFSSQGIMTFNATGNSFRDADGSAVTFFKASAGTSLSGIFSNNTIGVVGVTNSGSKSGNGIFVSAGGASGTMSFTINNNQIHQIKGNAHIYADNTGGNYSANFTIQGNTLDTPGTGWFAGIAVTNGSPSSSDAINVCANIGGAGGLANTINVSGGLGIIVGSSGANGGHTFNLPGFPGPANQANVENFIQARNTGSFVTNAYFDAPATFAAFTGLGTTCPTP